MVLTSVSPQTTTFISDRSISQIDSYYDPDLGLEIAECQVADEVMGNMWYKEDEKDITQPPACGHTLSQDSIPVLEDHLVMSITIESSIRKWQMTPGTISHQMPTLSEQAGSPAIM